MYTKLMSLFMGGFGSTNTKIRGYTEKPMDTDEYRKEMTALAYEAVQNKEDVEAYIISNISRKAAYYMALHHPDDPILFKVAHRHPIPTVGGHALVRFYQNGRRVEKFITVSSFSPLNIAYDEDGNRIYLPINSIRVTFNEEIPDVIKQLYI